METDSGFTDPQIANQVFERIDELAALSEHPDHLTRQSFTSQHLAANELVGKWMRQAGLTAHTDAAGNIVGRKEGTDVNLRSALLMGSHLDSVRNAGRYDGPLGVVLPLVCLEYLHTQGESLPFPVEVVGFCDEEGVRFPSTLIGSRAIAGTLDPESLKERDSNDITLEEALQQFGVPGSIDNAARNKDDFLGFIECHIEQGPVLEREDLRWVFVRTR